MLAGQEVRLKFNMSDARLHAMYFDTEERPLEDLPPLQVFGLARAVAVCDAPL